ncbi:MAG: alpha/beta hydrolase [Mesorhizobium sp.]|nr:alpha/beta hydrolase [Mesorhizobium sp.]MBL8578566.1 alpha/beta hydrolase [Mesorhizobium sp.]
MSLSDALRVGAWGCAVIALSVLLASCSSRPTGVLTPTSSRQSGATTIDMLVATTRAPSNSPGIVFSGERGAGVSLTSFAISIPPNRQIGQVQWPTRLPANPSKDFTTISVTSLAGIGDARGWLKQNLPKSRRVLIFVHGFNNGYEDAVYRFAQIAHDSQAEAAPVLFTWPSRGSAFAYGFDRESANFSRDALEETIWQLSQDATVGDVTIMGHSMGAWLVMESLRQMAIRRGSLPSSIHNVILASPDIDVDVFGTQWRAMQRPDLRFTIFVSQADRALALSRRLAGRVDRLGQLDVNSATSFSLADKAGITVIDLSELRGGDSLNHSKFAESPEVVRLIGARLVAGQVIDDSDASLGERIGIAAMGVGQAVGGAAGAVITAPIVVLDPNTRRTYNDQLNQIGRPDDY